MARAGRQMHGKTSTIAHDGRGVFRGLPDRFEATRYHSLVVLEAGLPAELEISARAEDGEIMGLRHRRFPVEGVQFHPESILTVQGKALLANFLELLPRRRPRMKASEPPERVDLGRLGERGLIRRIRGVGSRAGRAGGRGRDRRRHGGPDGSPRSPAARHHRSPDRGRPLPVELRQPRRHRLEGPRGQPLRHRRDGRHSAMGAGRPRRPDGDGGRGGGRVLRRHGGGGRAPRGDGRRAATPRPRRAAGW